MDRKSFIELFDALKRELEGDWIIVGGALLHILGISPRETLDFDIVPVGEITNRLQLLIMKIADDLGYPPETINFGAEYFVKKIDGWENELVLLEDTGTCRIYRPTKKFFRRLKEARGSETDLRDIQLYENNVSDDGKRYK